MPGCAAIGCNNRSEKGYTMKCFPRDPILRQIWKDRVGRADWEPSNNSFLCHAHFAPNQWMVTQCGRLKLRKGAVPSIFRVVSTRKSPNKRRRLGDGSRSEDEEFGIEILDDEEENYIYLETPGTGRLQSLGDESIVFLDSQNSPIISTMKGNLIISNSSVNNLQHENVLVISDESNTGIGSFVHNSNKYIIINNENEDTNNQIQPIEILTNHIPHNSRIKIEVKDEVEGHATADEIYDEVESNMERIYEGINSDNESTSQKSSRLNKKLEQIEVLHKSDSISNGRKIIVDNDIKNMLRNSRSLESINNEEIIIGDENSDMKQRAEMSNLKAALQRKRKAREETMKSIERFISDSVEEIPENDQTSTEGQSSNINSNSSKRSRNGTSDIKFPEEIEDVSEIMRDLGEKPPVACILEENQKYGNKSVIRLENNLHKIIKTEKISNYDSEENLSDQLVNTSAKFPLKTENTDFITSDSDLIADEFRNENHNEDEILPDDQYQYDDQTLDNQDQGLDNHNQDLYHEEEDCQEQNQDDLENEDVSIRGVKRNRISESEENLDSTDVYYNLKLKIEQQNGTILKLTDHLSAYKDMENKMQEVNDELKLKNREISILSAKLNRKENHEERSGRNFAAMHALIKDLTHKVKTIEDVNRRLSRSITAEHQNKKNLEYQVKNREKTIKELNWKIEKASKLLERAERNANNYKRRVNNMRSLLKRKNYDLVHDQQSSFDVLFADYVKHEFSDESLHMAFEIQKLCGTDGYETLLSYCFPLPSLRTLRRRMQKSLVSEHGSSTSKNLLNTSNSKANNLNDTTLNDSNFVNEDFETKFQETNLTVTGTVQDIFNENNDNEDMRENEVMSENELKENLFKFKNVNF